MPIFHIKPGREGPFLDCFDKQFAEAFALITPAEAEQLRLFGPGPFCQQMRQRLGNFVGLAFEPAAIFLRPPGGRAEIHLAVHSGLSPRDMTIPLIIA